MIIGETRSPILLFARLPVVSLGPRLTGMPHEGQGIGKVGFVKHGSAEISAAALANNGRTVWASF
jgi:hypothetical protein